MSFIRQTQDGSYVDIPFGSQYYLYDNGIDIGGWTYEEFAGVVIEALDEVDTTEISDAYQFEIKCGFEEYFGGIDHGYRGGVEQPERAEIFCQCVDRRFDDVVLKDELHEMVQDSFDRDDYVFECENCGNELRPYIRDGEPYYCNDEECTIESRAESWGVEPSVVRKLNELNDRAIETDDTELEQELEDEWNRILEEKVRGE